MIVLNAIMIAAGLIVLAVALARLIFAVRPVTDRRDSTALSPATTGPLAESLAPALVAHLGKTGILPLQDGADALDVRIALADAAVSAIDVQYYIWRADLTGYLLLDALRRAADRGVRLRMLLDDNGIAGLDPALATLNQHPNIEVRLYNPFNLRRFKPLSYAFDFFRLNRRMHNKSFTVDGAVTILGGRNVGNEYFSVGPAALFVDLDVLVAGQCVGQVSDDFDRYWAAQSVHPAGRILGRAPASDPIATALMRFEAGHRPAHGRRIVAQLLAGDLALEWTDAVLVSDDPIKGQGAVRREDLLASRLMKAVGTITSRFDIVSPYMVPGVAGVRAFGTLRAQGVAVRILTNSLEATDVVPVHAGYAKRRKSMLRRGIKLFEMHANASMEKPTGKMRPLGSSGASLHAKTFAVDGARIFVGSFNFDPRSTTLNTEMGILIESSQLAEGLHSAFDDGMAGLAWRVDLVRGHTVWTDPTDNSVATREFGSTAPRRLIVAVVGWLPVEWLL